MDTENNPYVGPRTFERSDFNLFFGREKEAKSLYAHVVSEPVVLFHAPSGAGKSSLIQAKLIPELEKADFTILPVGRVSGTLPKEVPTVPNIFVFNLLLSLTRHQESVPDLDTLAQTSLVDFLADHRQTLQQTHPDKSPTQVLILDQFEEIITTHLDHWHEREEFFYQLGQAVAQDSFLWVLLSVREDYVAALSPYAPFIPNRLKIRFYMQGLNVTAARHAIEEPARQHGRTFAPGVADNLIENLRKLQSPDSLIQHKSQFVEPVQLQIVCRQLWQNLQDNPTDTITHNDIATLGTIDTAVDNALIQFYEQAITNVPPELPLSQLFLRDWFQRQIITESKTRGTVHMAETTAGLDNRIVTYLQKCFLLRSELRAGASWFELIHDRFVNPVLRANQQWLDGQPQLIQDAMRWHQAGRPTARLLYDNKRLAQLLANNSHALINDDIVQTFLQTSQQRKELEQTITIKQETEETVLRIQELKRKRLLRLWIVLIGILILLTLLTRNSFEYYITAQTNANQAATAEAQANEQSARADAAQTTAAIARDNAIAESTRALEVEAIAYVESTRANEAETNAYFESTRAAEAEINAILQSDRANEESTRAAAAEATAHVESTRAVAAQATAATQGDLLLAQSLAFKALNLSDLGDDTEFAALLAYEAKHILSEVISSEKELVQQYADSALLPILNRPYFNITLSQHQTEISAMAFAQDAQNTPWLASADREGNLILWDMRPQVPVTTSWSATSPINDLLFATMLDGELQLLLATEAGTIEILHVLADGTLEAINTLEEETAVKHIAYTPNGPSGRTLATSRSDGYIQLWHLDNPTASPRTLFISNSDGARAIGFSPDGSWMLIGNPNGQIQKLATNLSGNEESFDLDSAILSLDSVVDAENAQVTAVGYLNGLYIDRNGTNLALQTGGHVGAVTFAPGDDILFASGDEQGVVRLWTLPPFLATTTTPLATLSGPHQAVTALTFSQDGQWLASAYADGRIRVWNRTLPVPHLEGGTSLGIPRDKEWIISALLVPFQVDETQDYADLIYIHSLNSTNTIPPIIETTGNIKRIVVSDDGRVLITGNDRGGSSSLHVRILDDAWQVTDNFIRWPTYSLQDLALTRNGNFAAFAGNENGNIEIWNLETREFSQLRGHKSTVRHLAFSPDGQWLASAEGQQGQPGGVWIWPINQETGQIGQPRIVSDLGASALAFTPDSAQLAVAQSSIQLWLLADLLASPTQVPKSVGTHVAIAFSPDGTKLATVGKGLYLWAPLQTVTEPLVRFQTTSYRDVAFSNDGQTIFAATDLQTQLWPTVEQSLQTTCQQVRRNLNQTEWDEYLPNKPYRTTCPNLPSGADAAQSPTPLPGQSIAWLSFATLTFYHWRRKSQK